MDESVKQLKSKLRLYGSYTREYESLEREYFKYQEIMAEYDDYPQQGAKKLGLSSIDPHHPPEQQMVINEASFPEQLEGIITRRDELCLEELFNRLDATERAIIDDLYITELSYVQIGNKLGYSKQNIGKIVNRIFERVDASTRKLMYNGYKGNTD